MKQFSLVMAGILVFICAWFIGLGYVGRHFAAIERVRIESEGEEAAQKNIPPNANPYVRYPSDASAWLKGYMRGAAK